MHSLVGSVSDKIGKLLKLIICMFDVFINDNTYTVRLVTLLTCGATD